MIQNKSVTFTGTLILILALLTACSFPTSHRNGMTAEERAREEYDLRRHWGMFPEERALFDYDKYDIRPDTAQVLTKVTNFMKEYPTVRIEIQGHCDERGTNEYNYDLGRRRANAARNFIVSKGIDAKRITTVSFGKTKPLDSKRTATAMAKNRRVEIVILGYK